jgi:hypothetical protein
VQRLFGGLAVGIILISIALPLTGISAAYPANAADRSFQWSTDDSFNYTATITIDNSSHTTSTAEGYYSVLLEGILASNCTAILKIEQNIAFKGANPIYTINVPIARISAYIPCIDSFNFNNVSPIMKFLNFTYGKDTYSLYSHSLNEEILDRSLMLCEITFDSLNASGRIFVDPLNGFIVKGTVTCEFTDFNLQKNVEKNYTFMLKGTNVPMNTSNSGGTIKPASYPEGLIYFYYSIIGSFAFLFGIAIIWLLKNFRK